MGLLDPSELLKAFSPLLAENGGIKNAAVVPRVVSLMKRFSRKLVCRCIYCYIIKSTAEDVLDTYLDEEGWTLLYNWTAEAENNLPFLKVLLEVFEMLPMNVDRLKANGTAKIIKQLSKHEDSDLSQRADALVLKWRSLVKSSDDSSKEKDKSHKEKSKDDKEKDDKERRRDRKRSDDEKKKDDKDRHRHRSSRSDRDKDRKDRKDRRKDKDKESKSDKDRPSKKTRTENSDPSAMDTDVVPPRPPTPPEVRKPTKIERPKTVKEYGSKLRLASFLEEDTTLTKIKKKITKPPVSLSKPPVPISSLRSLTGPSGVRASLMNAHLNQPEQQSGNIKLIAPKSPHLIMENEGFMNALTASSPADKSGPPAKKKKKIADVKRGAEVKRGNSKDEESDEAQTSMEAEEVPSTSDTKEIVEKKVEEPPKLSFYKDTLEEEIVPKRTLRSRTRKAVIEENSDEEDDVQRMEDEASMESNSSVSQDPETQAVKAEPVEEEEEGIPVVLQTHNEKSENTSGVKPILTIVTNRNRIKKNVRWREEADLKTFHFFEHDPTERINVNNVNHMQPGMKVDGSMDIKMIEMRMERERLRAPNDRMEEQQAWRQPATIEIPASKAPALSIEEIGKNSEMYKIEKARQATVLEVIYFDRRTIPDSPCEPDIESRRGSDSTETKLIPIDTETVIIEHEEPQWTNEQNPAALPPALTDLLAHMNPGQPQIPLQIPASVIPPEIPIIPQGPPAYGQSMNGPPDMKTPFMMNGMPHLPPAHLQGMPGGPRGPMMHDDDGGHWGPMGGPQPDHHLMQGMTGPRGPHSMMQQHMQSPGINERRRGRGGGRAAIRGPPRTLCKFFKQGHCRFGPGCTFLHPGVNGPDTR